MWGRFFIPVLALFYIASHVSLKEFGIIMGVFSATIFIIEIPSGILADKIGKKNVLLISRFMYLVEVALLAFTNGFWFFLIAKFASGIGVSLSSGTSQALFYDSVKRLGKEEDFKKYFGTQKVISYASMGVVFIIGAYLFTLLPKLSAFVSLPFLFTGFLLTFFLKEPYPISKFSKKEHASVYFKQGLLVFKKYPALLSIVLFCLPIFIINDVVLANSSAYLPTILVPIVLIGLINFLINAFSSALLSKYADKIINKIKKELPFILVGASIISCLLLGFSIPYFGIILLFIISGSLAIFDVFLEDYSNKRISSTYRATSLSIRNMIVNIGLFTGYVLFGMFSEASLSGAFFGLAILLSLFVLVIYFTNVSKFENIFEDSF